MSADAAGLLLAAAERISAALALHYPAYDDHKRTPLCPKCRGAEGHHPCGCWSPPGGVDVVCGHCHTGGYRSHSVPYPCPTVRVLRVDDPTSREDTTDDKY